MTTFNCDSGGGTNITKGKGRCPVICVASHAVTDGGLGPGDRDGLPVCRNRTHALVESLAPALALLFTSFAFPFDINSGKKEYDEKGHKNSCGNFAPGYALGRVRGIIDGSNGVVRLGRVGHSRGTTRGRRLIGDSKDGARGIGGLERRGVGRNDRELEVGGIGGIPPLGFEDSLIRTGGEVDILPGVDAGGANAGGVEIYVGVLCRETRRVPCDADRCGIRKRLRRSRGLVETT